MQDVLDAVYETSGLGPRAAAVDEAAAGAAPPAEPLDPAQQPPPQMLPQQNAVQ